jgi:hypothetical protein
MGPTTIEMSSGFGFTVPRKRWGFLSAASLVSKDDEELEEGCALVLGKGAREKGQRPFSRRAL